MTEIGESGVGMTPVTAVGPLPVDSTAVAVPDDAVKKHLGVAFWICIGWMVLLVLVAVLAPILPIDDPGSIGVGPPREGPSLDHWFGTDALGRDVFARAVWGARISLVVGAFAIVFGMVVGGSLGMLAGFLRGWVDQVISFAFFTLLSFPALILAILYTSTLDEVGVINVALVLGVLAVAPVGRLARAQTLVFAEREFVQAARVVGAKNGRILVRELLPNVLIPMSALALLGMGVAIVAEGGLAFLGQSVSPDKGISWGKLINDSRSVRDLQEAPHVAFSIIIVMFLTILALNFAGDRLREFFDVRETAF
jgi:peptide/nickel transport system permease protein